MRLKIKKTSHLTKLMTWYINLMYYYYMRYIKLFSPLQNLNILETSIFRNCVKCFTFPNYNSSLPAIIEFKYFWYDKCWEKYVLRAWKRIFFSCEQYSQISWPLSQFMWIGFLLSRYSHTMYFLLLRKRKP